MKWTRRDEAWRESLLVESQNGRMVRTSRYAYSVYDSGRNRESFYDHERDPGETVNVAYDEGYRTELQRHRELLREWVERVGDSSALGFLVEPDLALRPMI